MSRYIPVFIAFSVLAHTLHAQERLVKVNGVNFNVVVKGLDKRKKDAPVMVFENGMGVDWSSWDLVLDDIAQFVPVVAYDRSGVGKSDKVLQLPTPKLVAGNLKAILGALNIAPPYILVGHSMGGVYVRAFAGFYPQDVAGLAFLDPADFTESKKAWNDIFRRLELPEKKIDEMLYDRLYRNSPIDSSRYGPASELFVLTELRRTDFAEINSLPLPDVPICFFVGGKFEVPPDRRSKDFNHEEFFRIRTNINIERWKEFIQISSKGGYLIFLSKSGHYLQRDDPKAIVNHLRFLVQGT